MKMNKRQTWVYNRIKNHGSPILPSGFCYHQDDRQALSQLLRAGVVREVPHPTVTHQDKPAIAYEVVS